MAIGACGYNCGRELIGHGVQFPHILDANEEKGLEQDFSLCRRVHLDCLIKDAKQKMWNQEPLTCPHCLGPGDAYNRISRKERIYFQIHKHESIFTLCVIGTGVLVFGGAASGIAWGLIHDNLPDRIFLTIVGGFIGGVVMCKVADTHIVNANHIKNLALN